jgi:transposase
MIGKKLHLN